MVVFIKERLITAEKELKNTRNRSLPTREKLKNAFKVLWS